MTKKRQRRLALLIPAHNEELVIQNTLNSAIKAGLNRKDIYVVDDASSDNTLLKVGEILPITNILKVEHSGKAGAISKAIEYFSIESRYRWIHIADADSMFANNYFHIFLENLSDTYVATIGMVQSMRGNWLCSYRAISYTWGQQVVRRIQSLLGMISILPGPTTSFRTDIIKDLDFHTKSLTEDFDITLQIHRKKLGKIKYVPEAVNYTQDPNTIHDYATQSLRWYRGFFQGVRRYKIGLKPHRIDLAIWLIVGDLLISLLQLLIAGYIIIFASNYLEKLGQYILIDTGLVLFFIIFTAILTKRFRVLGAIFYYYLVKNFELALFIRAFIEVIVLRKYKQPSVGWKVEGRRYKITKEAMADFA